MARALPEHGKIISLELKEEHAQFARENIAKAGLSEQVELIVGDALESLNQLEKEQKRFDFFLIDADKLNYPNYLEKAIRLSNPGAVITADNLFLRGRVFDEKNQAPSPVTMRRFHQQIASDDRLESLILPLGDGLGVCRVKGSVKVKKGTRIFRIPRFLSDSNFSVPSRTSQENEPSIHLIFGRCSDIVSEV